MKQILNYRIHNILEIQIQRTRKFDLLRDIDLELHPFRVENITDPDVIFNIGKFTPSNNDCYIVDQKYYVKENYLYCEDLLGNVKWKVEIFGFEKGKTIVNFDYSTLRLKSLISHLSIETFLLKPIIWYKLSEKGYYMIHAAGVSKNGQAYIFPGRGGSFKTTLVKDFIKKAGFNYLGDDFVILHRNNVLSFPTYLPLFSFVYSNKKGEHLSIIDKVKFIVHLWVGRYGRYSNIPVDKSATLKSIFFVSKINKDKKISIKELSLKEAIDKLIENNKMEIQSAPDFLSDFSFGPYYTYMLAYSYVFPNSLVAKCWDSLKENLESILKNIPIYEIELPKKYNSSIFQYIYKRILEVSE